MKEKKHGKLIFAIAVIVILALQAPVRNGVYHFFTHNDIGKQMGVKQKTRTKIKKDSHNLLKNLQDEVDKVLKNIKEQQNKK
ncbi:hypothetical protein OGZ51_10340 [Lactococcus lactis]|uniref:Uncharacterized protein n=1 Tax=Lactococcus lactis TaxID=1358 RepID=A0A9X4NKS0_9LACT|nr:hypothetical protein [Lactococcus lactis]MDG4984543.1 hypothetical protein [Lactococcus lactis]